MTFPIEVILGIETSRLLQLHRHTGDTPSDEIGDCFRTSIACLFGYPDPTYVPHFVRETITLGLDDHGGWEDITAARRWARAAEELDLALVDRAEVDRLGVAAQATVRSHAGPWNHSVVYQAGEVTWCPSTGDSGAYKTEDLIDGEPMLVVCQPYDPGPDELLARWRVSAEVGG